MAILTYREAIAKGIREGLDADPRVFLMGEDVGPYGGAYAVSKGMVQQYSQDRIIDTPLAESVIVGAGVGAAMGGLRPIVEIMTINFSLLAADQIVNSAAKLRYMSGGQIEVPLIIRTVSGGGAMLGATHSQSLEGWYARVPGLYVVVPSSPYDALGLFRTALAKRDPVLFVEHSLLYPMRGEVPDEHYTVPFGLADVKRHGKDVTIVGYLRMTQVALRAAEKLAEEGIDVEVVDLRSLRPLDRQTILESVMRTNRALVLEEGWKTGGFGAEVASIIAEEGYEYLDAPVKRLAGKEVPMPYTRPLELRALPSEAEVMQAVKELLE